MDKRMNFLDKPVHFVHNHRYEECVAHDSVSQKVVLLHFKLLTFIHAKTPDG